MMPTKSTSLVVLMDATPSARGPEGAIEMLKLQSEYERILLKELDGLLLEYYNECVRLNRCDGNMSIGARNDELREIDEAVIIPRPEQITTPEQVDNIIGQINEALSRIGRMWNVAATRFSKLSYEISLIEAWLQTVLLAETKAEKDAQTVVLLAKDMRWLTELQSHIDACERTHKRLATQLPSLRDMADRRYQDSRYHPKE